jgi:hypothetical protein
VIPIVVAIAVSVMKAVSAAAVRKKKRRTAKPFLASYVSLISRHFRRGIFSGVTIN